MENNMMNNNEEVMATVEANVEKEDVTNMEYTVESLEANKRTVGAIKIEKRDISVKDVANDMEEEEITADIPFQRPFVWNPRKQSELIESIIMGFPIPEIYANEEDGELKLIDGQQRCKTVTNFLHDKFALKGIEPVVNYVKNKETKVKEKEIVVLNRKKFSDLPEDIQYKIATTIFRFIITRDLSYNEQLRLFRRLNNGQALSNKDKVNASCQNLDELIEIGAHPVFSTMFANALKKDDRKAHVQTLMKIWFMLNKPINEISFENANNKDAIGFTDKIKKIKISEEEMERIKDILDFANDIHSSIEGTEKEDILRAKKFYTEIHFVSMIPFMADFLDRVKEPEYATDSFIPWLLEDVFKITETTVKKTNKKGEEVEKIEKSVSVLNEEYSGFTSDGTGRTASIVGRHNALKKSYEAYFANKENLFKDSEEAQTTEE